MNTKLGAAIGVVALGLLFARWFFSRSADPMKALQTFAIEVLRQEHLDWAVERSAENGIAVRSHGKIGHIYLDNILREAGSDRTRAQKRIEQSAQVLSEQPELTDAPLPSLAAVKARLRPTLVPREYAEHYELAAATFADGIAEAVVVDDSRSTRYVRSDDLKKWQAEFEPLRQLAEAALWEESRALKLEAQHPADATQPGKFVVLTTHDGYDAARLAIPEMRKALGAELGYPFYAAVPNRDFLVAWSNDYAFAEQFAAKVRADFGARNHPISPKVYRVDADRVESLK